MDPQTARRSACRWRSRGASSGWLHDACRDSNWHALGVGDARINFIARGSGHEALAGGSSSDAFETGGEICGCAGICAWRDYRGRCAIFGKRFRARRMRTNPWRAGSADCFWCCGRAYAAANVDGATGLESAFEIARRRRAGDSGAGGGAMSDANHVHVIGIGGSAMAPLAGMLREHGYRVTGSDSGVYPPASTLLEKLGISFFHNFDAAHLSPAPDLVVVGNIIARGNPELEEVLDRKIPYRSMPEILEEVFLPGRHSIVVSGTHGKTTTTAMLAWIFQTAGKRPNFLVGGVAENFGKSYGLGGGEEFILEGDEYETAFWDRGPKFFHYHPDDLIITSLEFDHADIYRDFETYELAFRRLVNLVPRRGRVVIWGDTAESGLALRRAAEKAFCPVETYGFSAGNDWLMSDLAVDGAGMKFRVLYKGKHFGDFALAASGRHNVLNAMAAMAVAHGRVISAEDLAKA